jgi:hypothetical protein
MDEYKKSEDHLIDLILDRNNNTPNFAILLGSGASITSGVKSSNEMIEEWRQRLYEQSHSKDKYSDWLSQQKWFNSDKEYSILFEMVCDTPAQRRIYIENCVKDAKASWGYIYLANLMANNYFNIVFTTNFDDLVNEACFLYTDIKPIVCAHDSVVANVRVTSTRPKIIKLHGDFLYDNIKNTVLETKSLETNMENKFSQFCTEYGLVVIGYGGNDDSVMTILKKLLKIPEYFPNGIYWCVKKGTKLPKKVTQLTKTRIVFWIEIEGFDEYFACIHKKSKLQLPDLVKDPYKATTESLNKFLTRVGGKFVSNVKMENPIIAEDINELQKTIKAYEQAFSQSQEGVLDKLVPYAFLGVRAFDNGNYYDAITYFKKAEVLDKLSEMEMYRYCLSFLFVDDVKNAETTIKRMAKLYEKSIFKYHLEATINRLHGKHPKALSLLQQALDLTTANEIKAIILTSISNLKLIMNDAKGALADAEKALEIRKGDSVAMINRSIALKKLGRTDEAMKILDEVLKKESVPYFRSCVFAVMENKKEMLKELKLAVASDIRYIFSAKTDPDFIDYRDDPEFKEIVYNTQINRQ